MFGPLDPEERRRSRKSTLAKWFIADGPYFIHVSERNWARKNVLNMIRAYEKARVPEKLIIVGKMQPEVHVMAQETYGVKTLGFVSEEHLAELIQNAEAMIFPSLHEGFGHPSVEAISCGIPAIASDVFSSPEVLGEGAVLVDPYDLDDMVEKIELVSSDAKLRQSTAKRAALQSKKYSWRKTAAGILELAFQSVKEKWDRDPGSAPERDFDFARSYETAARRTIATVFEGIPELAAISREDFLTFDYTRIVGWCLEVGMENDWACDFLKPYEGWLNRVNTGDHDW